MHMFCNTVTRPHTRRETAPLVTPAASASEMAPGVTRPEVVVPTAQATEVAAEEHSAASESAAAEDEAPLVPGGDSSADVATHVSASAFVVFACYRVRDSAPDGSSPRGYVQPLAVGRRLILATNRVLA